MRPTDRSHRTPRRLADPLQLATPAAAWLTAILVAFVLAGCWGGPDVTPLDIPTPEPAPQFGPIGPPSGLVQIEFISQTDLSIFFSQYEDDSDIPPEVLQRYLTDPALMEAQVSMITDLIDHLQAGGAPLTPQEFYSQALAYTGDPGTALIVCHNVLKAMARGRSPIPWEEQSEVPLVYLFDGQPVNGGAMPVHPDAATGVNVSEATYEQLDPATVPEGGPP